MIAAPPHVHTQRAAAGAVRATVSYVQLKPWRWYTRLAVVRDGTKVLDVQVTAYSKEVTSNEPRSLKVRDLDGDGEPEILVDFWTGGAHCCAWTRIYHWDGTAYRNRAAFWGDSGYRFESLGDGGVDFVTADDRFAYAFASFAASGLPIRILAFRSGRLVDVTNDHRPLVVRDAAVWWRAGVVARRQHDETGGVYAAWAADESRLGKGAAALAWLRRHHRYPTGLARFLVRLGFTR